MINQFIGSIGVNKDINIFLDNNIIQDVKHSEDEERRLRFIGVFLFFELLKTYLALNIKLVLSPVIFYEHTGKEKIHNNLDYDKKVHDILSILSIFNLEVSFYKFDSYKKLNEILNDLISDEKKIIDELNELKSTEFEVNLINKDQTQEVSPLSVSINLQEGKLDLKYFKPFYVNFILSSKIEKKILDNNKNDKNTRRKYSKDLDKFPLSSLIKIKKGSLQGLGDIELFQECDLSSQYTKDAQTINVAITFDKILHNILSRRQTLVATHEPIITGEDSEISKNKLNDYFFQQQVLYDIEKEEIQFYEDVQAFKQNYLY